MKKSKFRAPRPPKNERDALRRTEIAAAAKYCFVRHGFHGASMVQIAGRAGMSVGQIYRYFANKEAIVHTIVEQIVAKRLKKMPRGTFPEVAKLLASRELHDTAEDMDDHTLMLEVAAEATRNSEVARIMREYDRRLHANAVEQYRRESPGLSEREAQARVEFMAVLFEGTGFRGGLDRIARPELLTAVLRRAIDAAMEHREFDTR